MKKCIAIALLLVVAASAAFTLDFEMSAGLGGVFTLISLSSDDFGVDQSYIGYGIRGFFDITYLEAGFAYIFADEDYGNYTEISVLAKYPFDMSSFRLFPMLGVAYQMNADYEILDALYLKAGVGADVDLSEMLYVRPTAIVGYHFSSDYKDVVDDLVGIDVEIGVAVGFKF